MEGRVRGHLRSGEGDGGRSSEHSSSSSGSNHTEDYEQECARLARADAALQSGGFMVGNVPELAGVVFTAY